MDQSRSIADRARALVDATARALPTWREKLTRIVTDKRFERFIIVVIVLNAITLGLETSKTVMAGWGELLHAIDSIFLAIFVVELVARMIVFRGDFWRDPWSLFDLFVVAIALAPASGDLAILRALRVLRTLRLITAVPSIRRVVASLLSAIPGMGAIIALLLIINYVFAVMATKLFGEDFQNHFGTLGGSFFTFFQIMTLEGWSGEIVRPVMEKHPWAWMFFVPYIILATFMVLNLFIGIVVDAIQRQNKSEGEEQQPPHMEPQRPATADMQAVVDELKALRLEVARLSEARQGEAAERLRAGL